MLTKNNIKIIRSLKDKKGRLESVLFCIEGIKSIRDLSLSKNIRIQKIFSTPDHIHNLEGIAPIEVITREELIQISTQTTPEGALALCSLPQYLRPEIDPQKLYLALDDIRDPGNLGTIIRLAHWFGVEDIICSRSTVDVFNPKVVQSTMGSIGFVRVHYVDLEFFLKDKKSTVYGTFLNGENIYTCPLQPKGIIVIGNEANGISPEIEALTDKKITIPSFGIGRAPESLNAAMATSIILSEFSSKKFDS